MSTCDLFMLTCDLLLNKSHVNIIMLHVNITKSHVDIIMLHVDINKVFEYNINFDFCFHKSEGNHLKKILSGLSTNGENRQNAKMRKLLKTCCHMTG